MSLWLLPYNSASKAAKALSEAGGFKRILRENSRFRPSSGKKVINYGCSAIPGGVDLRGCKVFNNPEKVTRASNKLHFFEDMQGDNAPRVPEWTTDAQTALNWFTDRQDVMARTLLNGSGGEGIVFFSDTRRDRGNLDNILNAPLFVQYKKKSSEYRIHFLKAESGAVVLVDQQKKVLRANDDEGNPIERTEGMFRIRNHSRGFIFQRNDVTVPADALAQAERAFVKSGLDFGAVDVIWNVAEQKAYVLEINTAPGLEGQTAVNYAEKMTAWWDS